MGMKHTAKPELPAYLWDQQHRESAVRRLRLHYPATCEQIVAIADEVMNRRFPLMGNPPDIPYWQVGRPIRWGVSPNGDREGFKTLQRMGYVLPLAQAYWLTGDERYIGMFIELCEEWIAGHGHPPEVADDRYLNHFGEWNILDTALRAKAWLQVYVMSGDADCWTDDFQERFLSSLELHGHHLAGCLNREDHNHTLMEMDGLLMLACLCPQLPAATEWKGTATALLERCMQRQVHADGVHLESTPWYHQAAIFMLGEPLMVGMLNHVRFSAMYYRAWIKMFDFCEVSFRPNGQCSPFGDSDVVSMHTREDYQFMQRLAAGDRTLRLDQAPSAYWLWWSDECFSALQQAFVQVSDQAGAVTRSEEYGHSRAFPAGGFYCLRSGADDQARYALLRCGPSIHGHVHADLLSFDLYAYGRPLLTDVGKFTYNACTDRRYLKGTTAHNTLAIDGYDQAEYKSRMSFHTVPDYRLNRWVNEKGLVLVDAEHEGYRRLPDPVTHRRQLAMIDECFYVVIDHVVGTEEHDVEQFWHFADCEVELAADGRCCTTADSRANLLMIPLLTAGMQSERFISWISERYRSKQPAAVVRYWVKMQTPGFLATLLVPYPAGGSPVVEIEPAVYRNDEVIFCFRIQENGPAGARPYEVVIDKTGKLRVSAACE